MFAATTTADAPFLEQIGPTLVAVVLTGIVGVAAAWAGRRWEQRAGHAEWTRDRRQEAFADLISTATRAWSAAADLHVVAATWQAEPEQQLFDEYMAKSDVLAAARDDVTRAYALVMVVGPDRLIESAKSVGVELDAGIQKALAGEMEGGKQRGEQLSQFASDARQALGT